VHRCRNRVHAKASRGTVLMAAAVCILSACNGTLRFDETALDAGPDGLAPADLPADAAAPPDGTGDAIVDAPDAADASCGDTGSAPCGWRHTECEPNSDDACEWHCLAGLTCTNGACGTGCVAECLENSMCAIATGDVSRVECRGAASCAITLGAGGNAACTAGSSCQVRCAGRCAISCQVGATCQLRCADAADFTTVTGTASCP
jgi:hypothetical protein